MREVFRAWRRETDQTIYELRSKFDMIDKRVAHSIANVIRIA